jgi:hydroxypyruvate reductase
MSRLAVLREDALAVASAAISAVDAGTCMARALPAFLEDIAGAAAWHVVAAGKAAGPMIRVCLAMASTPPAHAMIVAPRRIDGLPPPVERLVGSHPTPDDGSVAAGRRALEIAMEAAATDVLLVLLSGGASSLLELPADGVTLGDLREATDRLLRAGAGIDALNTVRKHLSRVKGGRLAAAVRGRTIALAISDVVGDDPSIIGSGPTVADPTTYADALDVLARFGGSASFPPAVVRHLERGARGDGVETPKPGSARLSRATTTIVGSRIDALEGARREAEARGYEVLVHEAPVIGDARKAAAAYAERLPRAARKSGRLRCVLSGGETTVVVTGHGRGGRNQEFALALAVPLAGRAGLAVVASVGTDGIDGPTDAAGALVDSTTASRAAAAGLRSPQAYLDDNDSHTFFQALGDLVVTGPTNTNVGDVQVALLDAGEPR